MSVIADLQDKGPFGVLWFISFSFFSYGFWSDYLKAVRKKNYYFSYGQKVKSDNPGCFDSLPVLFSFVAKDSL